MEGDLWRRDDLQQALQALLELQKAPELAPLEHVLFGGVGVVLLWCCCVVCGGQGGWFSCVSRAWSVPTHATWRLPTRTDKCTRKHRGVLGGEGGESKGLEALTRRYDASAPSRLASASRAAARSAGAPPLPPPPLPLPVPL